MSDDASATASEERDGPVAPSRGWLSAALVVALTLSLVELPYPPEPGLDPSYWQVLVHAWRMGLQHGPDIAFTYGPLGFLRSPFASDGVPAVALVWRTLGTLGLAWTLVAVTASLAPARRLLFCAAVMALCGDEQTLVVCATLVVIAWVAPSRAARWQVGLGIAWLAFLSHVKFTLLVQAACGVGAAAASRAIAGERRAALTLPLAFFASFVAFWLLAGQGLGNLPEHLLQGWEISVGYVRAMGVNLLTWAVWTAGHVTLGVFGAAIVGSLRRPRRLARAPLLLYLVIVWYLAWKHGFVRADGHVVGFFITCLVLAIAVPPYLGDARWSLLDACPFVCLAGLALHDSAQVARLPLAIPARLGAGLQRVVTLGEYRDELASRERQARGALVRADLRERVGRGTIDVLGHDQALVLMNELNYTPRPVFQSYSAYTPELLRLNQSFFASARAPEFVLARLQTIDGRFPTQDDALVLADLRLRYDMVHQTVEDALLRRRPARDQGAVSREVLFERNVMLDEEVRLPTSRDAALWLQVEARPTLRGRLRSLAHREAELRLVVTDESGATGEYRLIPSMAAEGFIIQPWIGDQSGLNAFLRGRGVRWAVSLRLETSRRYRSSWGALKLRVSRLPELPVRPGELSEELVESGVVNVRPRELHAHAPAALLTEGGRTVVQIHAPGRLIVPADGARRVTGRFGFRSGIVAPCDGAEFRVRIVRPDSTSEVLWRRTLDPLNVPADMGAHAFEVALPEGTFDVVFETDPGPADDASCDWTYWGDIRFLP